MPFIVQQPGELLRHSPILCSPFADTTGRWPPRHAAPQCSLERPATETRAQTGAAPRGTVIDVSEPPPCANPQIRESHKRPFVDSGKVQGARGEIELPIALRAPRNARGVRKVRRRQLSAYADKTRRQSDAMLSTTISLWIRTTPPKTEPSTSPRKTPDDQEFCLECGELLDCAGDGYDGLCPTCAARAENEREASVTEILIEAAAAQRVKDNTFDAQKRMRAAFQPEPF